MTERARALTLMTILLLTAATPAALGWGNDAHQEPSTPYDTDAYMWQTPNDRSQVRGGVAPDRIYFNGQLSSVVIMGPNADFTSVGSPDDNGRLSPVGFVRLSAILGFWRDCNNDGYIGDRATGLRNYPSSVSAVDPEVCPPNSPYNSLESIPGTCVGNCNPGGGGTDLDQYRAASPVVRELLPIGRDNANSSLHVPWNVNDSTARVWADITRPDQKAVLTKAITPLPYGTFDSWNGHIAYLDDLTFRQASGAYRVTCGATACTALGAPGDVYGTPLASNNPKSPVYSAYALYGQESARRGQPEGRPMAKVWHCADKDSDAQLQVGTDVGVNTADGSWSGGSVGDSINNTVKGLIIRGPNLGVEHSAAPWYDDGVAYVGQGCDGAGGTDALFDNGLSLINFVGRLQYEDQQNAPVKDRHDFFFTYAPPRRGAVGLTVGNTVVAQNILPGGMTPHASRPLTSYVTGAFNDGDWNGGIQLLRPTTNPDEFGYGVSKANWWTFYAKVNASAYPASAFSGATYDPTLNRAIPPAYRYGEEACTTPGTNGWDCSAWPEASEAWKKVARDPASSAWRVVLGEIYQLRDTDCTDLTPAAPGTVKPLRERADAEYNAFMQEMTDNDLHLFNSFC